jgi:hypothetical protein
VCGREEIRQALLTPGRTRRTLGPSDAGRIIMILGLSPQTFTLLHVLISLIGIAAGLIVLIAMFNSRRVPGWTVLFLATTVLTSATGFLFPLKGVTPALAVGVLSLLLLAAALAALYARRLAGVWRWIYVVTALVTLYLNCFVLVVQSFQKLPLLTALAPTQSEPPFLVAQVLLLALFVWLGVLAVKRFHPELKLAM